MIWVFDLPKETLLVTDINALALVLAGDIYRATYIVMGLAAAHAPGSCIC